MKDDGRSAARNAFVALLRRRVDSKLMHVNKWPLPDRPLVNPHLGAALTILQSELPSTLVGAAKASSTPSVDSSAAPLLSSGVDVCHMTHPTLRYCM